MTKKLRVEIKIFFRDFPMPTKKGPHNGIIRVAVDAHMSVDLFTNLRLTGLDVTASL
jgi:hypothetical protein